MKLSEKIIRNLNKKYFYTEESGVETENILGLLNEKICNFEQIVDKFKRMRDEYDRSCLYLLLREQELFKEPIQNNKLTDTDLKYLLNKIGSWDELYYLCNNTLLIKHILKEFILDKKILNKLNKIRDDNIFEHIAEYNRNNEELLKLIELNRVHVFNTFDLAKDQQLELFELIKDNEVALNRVLEVIENHLESNYDFDSLMSYLNKREKKNLMNI